MSKPKAAAKAVAVTPAAPSEPLDWPPGLVDAEVETFFEKIESGDHTVKSAAKFLGRKGNEVYRWARLYPKWSKRLEEAVDIGCLMAEDSYRDIKASDRDSAAGANIAFTGIDRYLKVKRPKVYNTSTFKPVSDTGNDVLIGVVVVPAKQHLLPHDVVDAEFSEIAVPAKEPA